MDKLFQITNIHIALDYLISIYYLQMWHLSDHLLYVQKVILVYYGISICANAKKIFAKGKSNCNQHLCRRH